MGQLNNYKTTLRLDLNHKFHRNYALNNVGALHLTNRYDENNIRNFYNHIIHDEDEGFSETWNHRDTIATYKKGKSLQQVFQKPNQRLQ